MKLLSTVNAKDIKITQPGFYIKNIMPIPKEGVTMLSSRGGYGKTFLSIRLGAEIAKENPNIKILMWLTEDPLGIIKNRMKAVIEDFLGGDYSLINNIEIATTTPQQFAYKERGIFKPSPKLSALVDDLSGYDVIFFDPLLAFFGGDENDNSQARIFMQPFMDYAKVAEKSIIFLHHSTKETKDIKSVTRGAGAFTDACRVVYELSHAESADPRLRKVSILKDNWGAKIHYGLAKEINVLPHKVDFNEDKEEYIDKVRISFSKDITENYKYSEIGMDKVQDLVKSKYYYSSTKFKNGYRKRENAETGQNLIILDFDEGTKFEDAKEMFSVYDCIIATTKSHQQEKNGVVQDRFRVILRTDKPIELTPDEYSKMMAEINKTYGCDEACKDVSRAWTPYKDADVVRFYGKPFQWRLFYNQARIRELKKSFQPDDHETKLRKAIRTLFDNEFTEGNRNNTAARALQWLRDEGLDEIEIKNILDTEIESRGGLGNGEKEKKQLFNNHLRSIK